jgi:hypothetical protein
MPRAFVNFAPEALSHVQLLPVKIVGTVACSGVCRFIVEGAEVEQDANYVLLVATEPMKRTAELRKVP